MLASKSLSLVEQKKLQWAREREEMLGLYGLWGKPKNEFVEKTTANSTTFYTRNNLLPPILAKNEESVKEFRPEDESETSGYLSDSPKRIKQIQESPEEYQCRFKETDHLSNEEVFEENQKNYWSESDKTDNYWADRKIYKNYKNENWIQEPQPLRQAQQSHHFPQQPTMEYPSRECNYTRMFHNDRNQWHQTPESGSSDDGNRLRWGDRGVGIGHLWDPVVNSPECRLPQVHNQFRQTPKWVEKGLKNYDGTKSEVLIINHPDDEAPDFKIQRNFILGQNAPIAPEVIEEREKKRKKAVEHQNAIKKQLEERAFKRQQEKERRLEEERLEEERIKKEQEIERIRYEEEQRKIREKEEMEKKREEAMKEAIEIAEKRAREEKKKNKSKRQVAEDEPRYGPSSKEKFGKLEKILPTEVSLTQRKQSKKYKKQEENESKIQQPKEEETKKILKDSSSQFEEIQLANSFQVLNMNGLPVEGGLALMLDNSSNDSSFLLPPDGVQLALLMSPRNTSATNRLLPLSPSVSESIYSGERTLTPSKFRTNNSRFHYVPSNKSTQTDFRHSMGWTNSGSAGKRRRSSLRCGSKTGCNTTNLKSGMGEKVYKHGRFCMGNKYRSKPSKLEDRPKWGINRPSVQYKKQSEKDPYYQKRLREKLRNNMAEAATSSDQTIKNEEEDETTEEKELDSVVRMLELREEERGKSLKNKPEIVLQNGFRMNSNLSSPVFVPIDNRIKSGGSKSKMTDAESEDSPTYPKEDHEEDASETEEEKTVKSNSGKFLNSIQLEAIEKISNLRECLWNLQKEYSNSRSTTPFSEKSTDKQD